MKQQRGARPIIKCIHYSRLNSHVFLYLFRNRWSTQVCVYEMYVNVIQCDQIGRFLIFSCQIFLPKQPANLKTSLLSETCHSNFSGNVWKKIRLLLFHNLVILDIQLRPQCDQICRNFTIKSDNYQTCCVDTYYVRSYFWIQSNL